MASGHMDALRTYGDLIPELDVGDLATSISFDALLGFTIEYERTDEGFAFLMCGSAQLMVQVADGPGRRFRTAALERPFGRGVNLQLRVDDVDNVHRSVHDAGHHIVVVPEDRWYRAETSEVGHRQFVVADPDGYLIRPFTPLGRRPA